MGYHANVIGNRTLNINIMNKIILLLLDLLKTAKTKFGKVILIVLIVLGLVYLCFATSCCSVSSSTCFSVDSAKVSNLNYHKSDSVQFQKFF